MVELGSAPVAEANPVALRGVNELQDTGDQTLFEVRVQGVLCQSGIRCLTSLNEQRVGTEAKHVVVCVRRSTVGGAAERTRQKLGPALVGKRTLALVVPNGLVTFVKKFFVVAAGSLWK